MFPSREVAEKELEIAGQLNQGPWTEHSINVGLAAQIIAKKCSDLNPDKAYVLGLLHDIGRRYGISARRHGIDGYKFMLEKGWGEVGRICLTHSFPIPDFDKEIGQNDMSDEESKFVRKYINDLTYDDYDRLLILCDSLADAQGFCMLEKRFVNTTRRYGTFPFTVERWNATFEMKEYFEKQMNCSIYDILPNIKETTFMEAPLWKPPVK
ncbi:HD domain-containing protein [Clostridium beijerinckii]|uniref:Phosphohydrolase n=1 Tax=Clostridium beijerinckii TaxID=1520 RepID=A0A1S9N794_CLOBE|nr:HD domain-containing protein [Clostridium beijerinckii]MZK49971.1 HDOD domain-containing protein [Clostridium beijerinckii]MZK58231.1 HDOD domain-containing protein [Clostridium beijerinckii]MZK69821.1 HDOD domain-containing protein [Clostridium beijerinckii]MZK75199.1 HDOD domain-containing protein [Clostridium beijerinckii]MZK83343.1 HDOD domain-containing protein [Clostridium beijerinckii]